MPQTRHGPSTNIVKKAKSKKKEDQIPGNIAQLRNAKSTKISEYSLYSRMKRHTYLKNSKRLRSIFISHNLGIRVFSLKSKRKRIERHKSSIVLDPMLLICPRNVLFLPIILHK